MHLGHIKQFTSTKHQIPEQVLNQRICWSSNLSISLHGPIKYHFVNIVLLCSPSGLIVTTKDTPTLSLLASGFNTGTLLSALPDSNFHLYHEFNKFVLTSRTRILRVERTFSEQTLLIYQSITINQKM